MEKMEDQNGFEQKLHEIRKGGTRIKEAHPPEYDPKVPRLGRRESEPHSAVITYLFDVLRTNFPNDRVTWDLHHYFSIPELDLQLDIQFDISYFRDLSIPYELPSYNAAVYDNKVPTMAVNVLSKSTWKIDIGEHLDLCKAIKIPVYVVFSAYNVATKLYRPPFLRVYFLQEDGEYRTEELREITIDTEEKQNPDALIDLSPLLPFRLGIMQRKVKFKGAKPTFHMILVKPESMETFPTSLEKETARAEMEIEKRKQVEEEKKQVEKAKAKYLKLLKKHKINPESDIE